MPRFSANLGFLWSELPLLDRIDRAAAVGFPAVELHWPYDTPPGAVRDACARHGLQLLGLNTATGRLGEFGLGALPGREADFQAAFDQSLDYCRASGATAIHAMAGVVAPADRVEAGKVFRENLRVASRKAADHGITVLLEAINPRDKPDYFYATCMQSAEMIHAVGADNLKMMFDVYHVGVAEGDVLTKLERYMPVIGHVQVAAVPSRAEPDEGEIDYRVIFDALDRLGYTGFVGCEYRPRGRVEDGLGWVDRLGVKLDGARR